MNLVLSEAMGKAVRNKMRVALSLNFAPKSCINWVFFVKKPQKANARKLTNILRT